MHILYSHNDRVRLISPAPGMDVSEVARKDVPEGVPYLIVSPDDLPELALIEAWEVDFSAPDGVGIGAEAWFAEQEAQRLAQEEEWRAVVGKFEEGQQIDNRLPSLSARQFRLGLHANGLLSSVQSGIDAMDEPDKTAAQIEWEYATQIERDHPLVVNLAAQLGLADEQIDAMWREAMTL